jgi:hypothetical protein
MPSAVRMTRAMLICTSEGAAEMLDEYIDANGGREAIEKEAREAALAKKQETKPWQPPPGLWDDEIEEIRLREEDGRRIGYCWWQNGEAARYPVELLHKRAPQTVSCTYAVRSQVGS